MEMKKYLLWLLVALVFVSFAISVGNCDTDTAGIPDNGSPERVAFITGSAQKISLKIMPLGDSITFGTRDPSYGGYRHLLLTLLINNGYKVDFVGSQRSHSSIPIQDNEGHPGWTITQIKNGIDSNGWLEIYQPDVILLHIGSNDIRQGNAASSPGNLSELLDDILVRLPKTHVIVAQIIPFQRGPEPGHKSYNAAIPDIVASKGPRVSMVDMQNILFKSDYADGLHPNTDGYDKIARAWEPAIRAVVSREIGVKPANLSAPQGKEAVRPWSKDQNKRMIFK